MGSSWRPFTAAIVAAAAIAAAALVAPAAHAQTRPAAPEDDEAEDFTELSLEELMQVSIFDTPVTSVTRQKSRVAEAPAAVHVITQDDVRRSGHTSIPELLRLVPGIHVARMNASRWAISSRGFTDPFADKLLVLQDGRTLYNPLYSGVFWEAQDYLLQDVDRVEVIRGPGATLWGANAVNGVINITTKSARDTQGTLVHALGGLHEATGGVRHGGAIDDQTFYRVFARYRGHDGFEDAQGSAAGDDWDQLRAGFRIDRYVSDADTFTALGEAYDSDVSHRYVIPQLTTDIRTLDETFSSGGGHLLARWSHVVSDTSDWSVQFFYDRIDRDEPLLGYQQDTLDLEFQHNFALSDRQHVVWGLGYRFVSDRLRGSELFDVIRADRSTHLLSAFVQDNVTLVPERLHLFAGSKFELNSYTGFEVQPGVRALWTPDARNSAWAAVSRAVRTPTRLDEDVDVVVSRLPTGFPLEVLGTHNGRVDSGELMAYEAGYRTQPTRSLTLELAGFFNRYEDMQTYARRGTPFLSADPPPPHVVVPYQLDNSLGGNTWGAELSAVWQVNDAWRLSGSYTWLQLKLDSSGETPTDVARRLEDSTPEHQYQLHSYLDVTRDVELNASLYYTGHLNYGDIPASWRMDLGLTWRPKPGVELMVGVQNLLDRRRSEFNAEIPEEESEIERTVYGQLVLKF